MLPKGFLLGTTLCAFIAATAIADSEASKSNDVVELWAAVKKGKELMEAQDLDQARNELNDALEELESYYGRASFEIVPAILILATTNAQLGRKKQQKQLYQRALKLVKGEHGADSIQYADVSYEAGHSMIQYHQGVRGIRDGIQMIEDARVVYSKLSEAPDSASAKTALAIGESFLRVDQVRPAHFFFSQALQKLSEDELALVDDHIRAHAGLVSAFVLQGQPDMANDSCRAIRELSPASNSQSDQKRRIPPIYPWHLVLTGVEGRVEFFIDVDEEGFVTSPTVKAVYGHKDFVPAALKSLCSLDFDSEVEAGMQPAPGEREMKITFRIDD